MATPFISQLLVDLCDSVRALKKENKDLIALAGDARARVDAQTGVEGKQRNQIAVQDAQNAELVGRANKFEKERLVLMFVIAVLVAIVVGLMCSK